MGLGKPVRFRKGLCWNPWVVLLEHGFDDPNVGLQVQLGQRNVGDQIIVE